MPCFTMQKTANGNAKDGLLQADMPHFATPPFSGMKSIELTLNRKTANNNRKTP